MFRDPVLRAGFATSALVSTVMMATLMVGPFYLLRALGLSTGVVGIALAVGPLVVALSGVPAGRLTDRFGAQRITVAGLFGIAAGALVLSALPSSLGIFGYLGPLVVMTAGYAMFQTANNTAVMTGAAADQRGAMSGMLNLSRNLGLITGASLMGAVFAAATGAGEMTSPDPEAVARGMRVTFAVGTGLIFLLSVSLQEVPSERVPRVLCAPQRKDGDPEENPLFSPRN